MKKIYLTGIILFLGLTSCSQSPCDCVELHKKHGIIAYDYTDFSGKLQTTKKRKEINRKLQKCADKYGGVEGYYQKCNK